MFIVLIVTGSNEIEQPDDKNLQLKGIIDFFFKWAKFITVRNNNEKK